MAPSTTHYILDASVIQFCCAHCIPWGSKIVLPLRKSGLLFRNYITSTMSVEPRRPLFLIPGLADLIRVYAERVRGSHFPGRAPPVPTTILAGSGRHPGVPSVAGDNRAQQNWITKASNQTVHTRVINKGPQGNGASPRRLGFASSLPSLVKHDFVFEESGRTCLIITSILCDCDLPLME